MPNFYLPEQKLWPSKSKKISGPTDWPTNRATRAAGCCYITKQNKKNNNKALDKNLKNRCYFAKWIFAAETHFIMCPPVSHVTRPRSPCMASAWVLLKLLLDLYFSCSSLNKQQWNEDLMKWSQSQFVFSSLYRCLVLLSWLILLLV